MRRWLLIIGLAIVVVVAVYEFGVRNRTAEPALRLPRRVAVIGTGATAVAVGGNGSLFAWLPAPKEGSLPQLPLSTLPKKGRLGGTLLEQVRVLAAAPAPLLGHVEKTYYGESGVDVVLRSGIELRFGDASLARRKWRAAAAILASPSTTTLDYVDLYAPSRPDIGGSGHTLPPPP